ncbi:unnamed protein product, partial [Nesidiocoris tenuis]
MSWTVTRALPCALLLLLSICITPNRAAAKENDADKPKRHLRRNELAIQGANHHQHYYDQPSPPAPIGPITITTITTPTTTTSNHHQHKPPPPPSLPSDSVHRSESKFKKSQITHRPMLWLDQALRERVSVEPLNSGSIDLKSLCAYGMKFGADFTVRPDTPIRSCHLLKTTARSQFNEHHAKLVADTQRRPYHLQQLEDVLPDVTGKRPEQNWATWHGIQLEPSQQDNVHVKSVVIFVVIGVSSLCVPFDMSQKRPNLIPIVDTSNRLYQYHLCFSQFCHSKPVSGEAAKRSDHCNKTVDIYEDVTSPEVTPETFGRPMTCWYRFRSFRGTPRDWILRIRFKKFKVGTLVNATTCLGGYMQSVGTMFQRSWPGIDASPLLPPNILPYAVQSPLERILNSHPEHFSALSCIISTRSISNAFPTGGGGYVSLAFRGYLANLSFGFGGRAFSTEQLSLPTATR